MKQLKIFLLVALTLTLFSCGQAPTEDAAADISVQIGLATAPPYAQVETDPTKYTAPPPIGISYPYNDLVTVHHITSGTFSWTVDLGNGVGQTTHADGLRPCDAPGTQHIPLKQLGEYGYTVDISLTEEIIQSYTLKAYPVGRYDFNIGTDCAIEEGRLAVLKGKYYYELIIDYIQGRVVYGFFID